MTRTGSPTRALLALLVLWTILFSPQLFAHRVFLFGDATLFRRFSEFSRQRWVTVHERSFWNPYVFFGLPATASLADQRPQYLPDVALDVWERLRGQRWVPPLAAPLLAHLAGVLSIALLARALWGAGSEGMVWAGLGWALMPGLVVPFTFGHDAQFLSASLIPAFLLLVHHCFAAPSRSAIAWATLGIGAVLGVQLLHGHPQMVAAELAIGGAFALERALRYGRFARLGPVLAGMALGIGIGAVSWWPAYQYSALSVRGGSAGVDARDVADFSQSWRDLFSLAWPRAVGFGGGTYWGGLRRTDFPQFAGTLICALSLFAWPRRGRREAGAAALLAAAAAGSVLLSLGSNVGPVDGWLRQHLPLFSRFRVSVVWLILADLALLLLSALGLERIRAAVEPRDRVRTGLAVGFGTASLLCVTGLAFALTPLRELIVGLARDYRPSMSLEAARASANGGAIDLAVRGLLLSATASMWLFGRRWRLLPAAATVALALHSVDLGSVSVPFLLRTSGPAERLEAPAPPEIARLAAADPFSRAMPLESDPPPSNDWVSWRARCAGGVHGAISRDWGALMAAGLPLHYEALCALSIRYTTVRPGTEERAQLWTSCPASSGGPLVIRLKHALDRAYCVPRVIVPGGHEQVLAALLSPEFQANQCALAEAPELAGEYPGSAATRLRWLEDSPDRVRIECEAPAAAFLVVADAWFPGWSATLDGAALPIARVDYLIRGVRLPEGRHVVVMRYRPAGWDAALPWTRGCLALLVAAFVWLGTAHGTVRRRSETVVAPGA
jgi:hypothetical protein